MIKLYSVYRIHERKIAVGANFTFPSNEKRLTILFIHDYQKANRSNASVVWKAFVCDPSIYYLQQKIICAFRTYNPRV